MMYKMNEKVILTDCDGVLMDWLYSFNNWMRDQHGLTPYRSDTYNLAHTYGIQSSRASNLVKEFNASASIAYLTPFRDAVKYVKKLHEEHGYVFHCITSLSLDEAAYKARLFNLEQLFGKTAFEKLICLDTGADKDLALDPYEETGCIWIEDKPENAALGTTLGLDSILIDHDFNADYDGPEYRAYNWKDVYEYIVG